MNPLWFVAGCAFAANAALVIAAMEAANQLREVAKSLDWLAGMIEARFEILEQEEQNGNDTNR